MNHLKTDGHMRQRQRMAQGNQVAGFFGRHDARNARNAQHIALFCGARFNDGERGGQHFNAPARHRNAAGAGLAGHIDHVGLALCVKMSK